VYFQRHSADEIAWHARQLYFRVEGKEPLAKARLSRAGLGLQVMIYLPDQKQLFARICSFFGNARLSILDAKVHTTRHGYALDTSPCTIRVIPTRPIATSSVHRVRVEAHPRGARAGRAAAIGRISRHLKHFPLTPRCVCFPDDKGTHYILEIVAGDRPGLLARIAYTLASANINVASAKINTLANAPRTCFLSMAPGCTTS